jgi:hypothetical protein
MDDRRRSYRLNLELPATFKLTESQRHLSLATTLDVSALGMCITSKEKISRGEKIRLKVKLPNNETVELKTLVVWVKQEDVYKDGLYTIGIKIMEPMSDDEAKFVKYYAGKFLDLYPPKSP